MIWEDEVALVLTTTCSLVALSRPVGHSLSKSCSCAWSDGQAWRLRPAGSMITTALLPGLAAGSHRTLTGLSTPQLTITLISLVGFPLLDRIFLVGLQSADV